MFVLVDQPVSWKPYCATLFTWISALKWLNFLFKKVVIWFKTPPSPLYCYWNEKQFWLHNLLESKEKKLSSGLGLMGKFFAQWLPYFGFGSSFGRVLVLVRRSAAFCIRDHPDVFFLLTSRQNRVDLLIPACGCAFFGIYFYASIIIISKFACWRFVVSADFWNLCNFPVDLQLRSSLT